jgi:peptide/nickel transport system substrate-binding protein
MAEPWGNVVAPYHAGYDPDLKPIPYDPEKAKQLLAEAGYPKGFDTAINTSAVYKTGSQAIQASLAKVGIRVKLDLVEHGMWRKMLGAKKFRNFGNHPTPWWNGRIHPATALQSTFDPKSAYTYTPDKRLEEEWLKLSVMIDEKQIAEQVRLLTRLYHEKMLRLNLWAMHTPFGLSKKIMYWKNPPGRVYPVNLEYVTLKD